MMRLDIGPIGMTMSSRGLEGMFCPFLIAIYDGHDLPQARSQSTVGSPDAGQLINNMASSLKWIMVDSVHERSGFNYWKVDGPLEIMSRFFD